MWKYNNSGSERERKRKDVCEKDSKANQPEAYKNTDSSSQQPPP